MKTKIAFLLIILSVGCTNSKRSNGQVVIPDSGVIAHSNEPLATAQIPIATSFDSLSRPQMHYDVVFSDALIDFGFFSFTTENHLFIAEAKKFGKVLPSNLYNSSAGSFDFHLYPDVRYDRKEIFKYLNELANRINKKHAQANLH